jgi:hypothetical protein
MPTNVDDIIANLRPGQRMKVEARSARLIAEETIAAVLGKRASGTLRYVEYAAKLVGSDSVFKRIGNAVDKNAIFNCITEIAIAWSFESIGLQPKFLPQRKTRGLDLLVSGDGEPVQVEVTRLQSAESDVAEPRPANIPYRDLPLEDDLLSDLLQPEDTESHARKFRQVIEGKIAQIEEGCDSNKSILVIWSSHEERDELAFRAAVQQIRRETEAGLRRVPKH